MRNLALATLALAMAVAMAVGAARADCPPGAPQGQFKGVEVGAQEPVEVLLNLACQDGRLSAQVLSSIGDWPASSVEPEGARVKLKFTGGSGHGSADLTLSGDTLSGAFSVWGERGTVSLARAGPPLAGGLTPTLSITPEQWRADVAAFGELMAKRHANAFAFLPRAKFDAEIAQLQRDAARLDGDQMWVRLQRIAAEVGDGHTIVVTPPDRRVLPIRLARFGEEIRVTGAGPGLEAALGANVIAIGGTPIDEAWRRAMTLTPQAELPQLQTGVALNHLARGLTLHGLRITPQREHAVFTLRDDTGRTFKLDVPGTPPDQPIPHVTSAAAEGGLAGQKPGATFWCQALDGAVYCDWRGYQDLKAHAAEMFALADQTHATKLVLDLRGNGGGDNTEGYRWIVLPLKARADLNRKGRLYVLVGSQTFSAAMNNAAQFQDLTAATLVGETIGETPNSYQEPRQFRLPNSHLVVRASTKFYKFRQSGPNRVAPDREIIPSWADVKAGRDPVLDWVLAQPAV
jgi:hypothetical protein